MKTFLIRGVPAAVQQDAWWLNVAPPRDAHKRTPPNAADGEGWRLLVLMVLIALGDVLIWQVVPGLSLAVFGGALVLAALWLGRKRFGTQQQMGIVGGGVLALLPLVEVVQPLTCIIAVVGVSALLAVIAGLRTPELVRGVLRLWPLGVQRTVVDAVAVTRIDGSVDLSAAFSRWFMAWFMPIVLGLVFVLLLLIANPVVDRWLVQLSPSHITLPDVSRVFFWLCLLPACWTVLSLRHLHQQMRAARTPAHMGPARKGLINPASVVRALLVFNLMFAVQTVLDAVYLYGGVGLPEGITYAQYAHRGAYPLVVTGLLAGGFALLTRRWVQGSGLLRGLLLMFVAQNVALVVSSLVRLDLYVDHYGLTQLRVAAAIWMGLTAAGLALILWQVQRGLDTGWLLRRLGIFGACVLYICAWVPFDAVIARHNLAVMAKQDYFYLCRLGDAAKPVLAAHELELGRSVCPSTHQGLRAPKDWREWGWRNARARTTLSALKTEARP